MPDGAQGQNEVMSLVEGVAYKIVIWKYPESTGIEYIADYAEFVH